MITVVQLWRMATLSFHLNGFSICATSVHSREYSAISLYTIIEHLTQEFYHTKLIVLNTNEMHELETMALVKRLF